MDNKKIIGSRINSALAMNNTLQKELAKQLNVKDNIVSYWCKGDRTPNTTQIIQIANCLNVSTDYLLGVTDVATNDKDLKFVCEYTGLDEKTIDFFVNNKHTDNMVINNFEVIEFIKFMIKKINIDDNCIFSEYLEILRDKTAWLCQFYTKNYDVFTDEDYKYNDYEFSQFLERKEEYSSDELIEFYKGFAENYELLINGFKYKVNSYLMRWVDEFALTYTENLTIEEFEKLQNDYLKERLSEDE